MDKPVYLNLSILEISKLVMYEIWYDDLKLKFAEKTNSCYMDIDSFIVYMKTEDIYVDIAKYNETIFDTSNYELEKS